MLLHFALQQIGVVASRHPLYALSRKYEPQTDRQDGGSGCNGENYSGVRIPSYASICSSSSLQVAQPQGQERRRSETARDRED